MGGDGTISLSGSVDASISHGNFSDSPGFGVNAQSGVSATIDDTVFADVLYAAFVHDGSDVTVSNSDVHVTALGFAASGAGANLILTDNRIVGPGAVPASGTNVSFGVVYDNGAGGHVDGNEFSNFLDVIPSTTSCGIFVQSNAGEVTIGTNTFPDPPRNEQNVCDNRP